jgi:predicted nucleic acid-binding protein
VNALVIDASIAVKWVVDEDGTPEALALRKRGKLLAPELLVSECANILWKKVRLNELTRDEALIAARLLQASDIELLPTRSLLAAAVQIAIGLDHPAYDCVYIALAIAHDCPFVSADQRLLRKLDEARGNPVRKRVISLTVTAQGN